MDYLFPKLIFHDKCSCFIKANIHSHPTELESPSPAMLQIHDPKNRPQQEVSRQTKASSVFTVGPHCSHYLSWSASCQVSSSTDSPRSREPYCELCMWGIPVTCFQENSNALMITHHPRWDHLAAGKQVQLYYDGLYNIRLYIIMYTKNVGKTR